MEHTHSDGTGTQYIDDFMRLVGQIAAAAPPDGSNVGQMMQHFSQSGAFCDLQKAIAGIVDSGVEPACLMSAVVQRLQPPAGPTNDGAAAAPSAAAAADIPPLPPARAKPRPPSVPADPALDDFNCPICFEFYGGAQIIICVQGHSLCDACARRLAPRKCPQCGQRLFGAEHRARARRRRACAILAKSEVTTPIFLFSAAREKKILAVDTTPMIQEIRLCDGCPNLLVRRLTLVHFPADETYRLQTHCGRVVITASNTAGEPVFDFGEDALGLCDAGQFCGLVVRPAVGGFAAEVGRRFVRMEGEFLRGGGWVSGTVLYVLDRQEDAYVVGYKTSACFHAAATIQRAWRGLAARKLLRAKREAHFAPGGNGYREAEARFSAASQI